MPRTMKHTRMRFLAAAAIKWIMGTGVAVAGAILAGLRPLLT